MSVEGQGDVEIFKRSILQRRLKYTTVICDGDSDTFKTVNEDMFGIYGERYKLLKDECT